MRLILLLIGMAPLMGLLELLLTNLLSSHMKNLQARLMTSTLLIRLVKGVLVLFTMLSSEVR